MRLLGIRSRTRRSTFCLIYHIFYFPIGKFYFYFCDLGSPSGGNVKWRTRQQRLTAGQATFLLLCAVETTHINIAMYCWMIVRTYMHTRAHTREAAETAPSAQWTTLQAGQNSRHGQKLGFSHKHPDRTNFISVCPGGLFPGVKQSGCRLLTPQVMPRLRIIEGIFTLTHMPSWRAYRKLYFIWFHTPI